MDLGKGSFNQLVVRSVLVDVESHVSDMLEVLVELVHPHHRFPGSVNAINGKITERINESKVNQSENLRIDQRLWLGKFNL